MQFGGIEQVEEFPARVELPPQASLEQGLLAVEVPVEPAGAGPQPRRLLDLRDRGRVIALPPEQIHRRVQHAFARGPLIAAGGRGAHSAVWSSA